MSSRRWLAAVVGVGVSLAIAGFVRSSGQNAPIDTSIRASPIDMSIQASPIAVSDCARWPAPTPTEPLAWVAIGEVVEVGVCRVNDDDVGGGVARGSFGAGVAESLVVLLDGRPIATPRPPGIDQDCPAINITFEDRLAFRRRDGAVVIVVARYDGCAAASSPDHGARYLSLDADGRLELLETVGALPLRAG